jgi:hypothetical protein
MKAIVKADIQGTQVVALVILDHVAKFSGPHPKGLSETLLLLPYYYYNNFLSSGLFSFELI